MPNGEDGSHEALSMKEYVYYIKKDGDLRSMKLVEF